MRVPTLDRRYSVALEWCGHPTRRYVARFCGDFLGQAERRADADALAMAHRRAFLASIEAVALSA